MAKKCDGGTYWLALVAKVPEHTILEAEAGYKPCKKPGMYIARQFMDGLRCPGCARRCRIPEMSGVAHDGNILLLRKAAEISFPECVGSPVCGGACDSCPSARRK